jgi:N6-adenosine-specific RNA methylase IME4
MALPHGPFRCILADPPWGFRTYSNPKAVPQRASTQHYPVMSIDEIAALPVASVAADDCVLFLWATWPCLPGAMRVIEAWGFRYKTAAFLWAKRSKHGREHMGMGYWTRANTEPCLLATRGRPRRKSMSVRQLIQEPVLMHSQKPEAAAIRIEQLVDGPYLELFARRRRDGWTVWGNEV